jgi:hypothetical protein
MRIFVTNKRCFISNLYIRLYRHFHNKYYIYNRNNFLGMGIKLIINFVMVSMSLQNLRRQNCILLELLSMVDISTMR